MKLSDIHKIDEVRKTVETGEIGLSRKTWVLENPSPQSIVAALDNLSGDTLGGWTGSQGTWVWDRFRTDHFHIAKLMGLDRTKAIPFYIKAEERSPDGTALEVNFETSEFSGVQSVDSLMAQPIINAVMRILAKRKEELRVEEPDDYSELLGSLGSSDY
jgi:hypothetical protein